MNQGLQVWRRPGLAVVGFSAALYLVACATPALTFSRSDGKIEHWFGFSVLTIGWMGAFIGQHAWFANLFLPVAWSLVIVRRWAIAAAAAALSALVAADMFRLYGREVPADEGGVMKLYFQHPHVGFYFWAASILVVVVGALALLAFERSAARP